MPRRSQPNGEGGSASRRVRSRARRAPGSPWELRPPSSRAAYVSPQAVGGYHPDMVVQEIGDRVFTLHFEFFDQQIGVVLGVKDVVVIDTRSTPVHAGATQ